MRTYNPNRANDNCCTATAPITCACDCADAGADAPADTLTSRLWATRAALLEAHAALDEIVGIRPEDPDRDKAPACKVDALTREADLLCRLANELGCRLRDLARVL